MKTTVVEMTCSEKRTKKNNYTNGKIENTIVFDLPYEKDNIYYQLSGGTKVELNTINQEAADMFETGKKYKLEISVIEDATAAV